MRPLCVFFLSQIYSYILTFFRTFCFLCQVVKSDIDYARAQAAMLQSSGHSVKEITKFLIRQNTK